LSNKTCEPVILKNQTMIITHLVFPLLIALVVLRVFFEFLVQLKKVLDED